MDKAFHLLKLLCSCLLLLYSLQGGVELLLEAGDCFSLFRLLFGGKGILDLWPPTAGCTL